MERIINKILDSNIPYFHIFKVGLQGYEDEGEIWLPGRNPFPKFTALNILKRVEVEACEDRSRRMLFGILASKKTEADPTRIKNPAYLSLKEKVVNLQLNEIDVFFVLFETGNDKKYRRTYAEKGIHIEDLPLKLYDDFDMDKINEKRWSRCEENVFDWHGQIPQFINLWHIIGYPYYALILKDFQLIRWEHGCWDFSGTQEINSGNGPAITAGHQSNPNVFEVLRGTTGQDAEIFEVVARAKLVYPFITKVWKPDPA